MGEDGQLSTFCITTLIRPAWGIYETASENIKPLSNRHRGRIKPSIKPKTLAAR